MTTDAPAGPLLELRRDPLSGSLEPRGNVPGEAVAAPGIAWALARIAVADTLGRAGQHALADRLLATSIEGLAAPDARGARDRLRVARARALAARGAVADGRAALGAAETAWGRHRRAALAAFSEAPGAVLDDLRARSGDAHEDGLADAWVVLVCDARQARCEAQDAAATLARAARDAPMAPATLRARAVRDRRSARPARSCDAPRRSTPRRHGPRRSCAPSGGRSPPLTRRRRSPPPSAR